MRHALILCLPILFAMPVMAQESPGPELSNPVVMHLAPDSGPDLYLRTNDFVAVTVASDMQGNPAIDLALNPEAARMLADITAQNIGRQIAISICGNFISQPVIQEHITSGSAQIFTDLDAAGAATMVSYLDGSAPCPAKP